MVQKTFTQLFRQSDSRCIDRCIFVCTHIGHSCKVGRSKLGVSNIRRNCWTIAYWYSIPYALNKIANSASKTMRRAATKAQDLRNIAKSYGVNMSVIRNERLQSNFIV
ncbi:hypothetical protein CEXT_585491 [Caerostris extrusa]|uniref:Uncharacterized protein n=1 Tax=Caerostris extrusa TaxID=172846 RepID=A0AAV4PFR8_CAEEX|nr:hypothetical protein CEXT_585491 [Caerostris extrusa]